QKQKPQFCRRGTQNLLIGFAGPEVGAFGKTRTAFEIPKRESVNLSGNHESRSGNWFFWTGIANAEQECAFPVPISKIHVGDSIFPVGKPESGTGNDFSCLEIRIAIREIAIPIMKLKKRSGNSLSRPDFKNSVWEFDFPAGKPESG